MSSQLVESLMQARAYPHRVGDVRVIETHVSWVLLTGEYAYKLKKPVDFGFLNFSTLDKRRHYCEEELRLNRRFAPDLYLEVVAITGTAQQPQVGGSGVALDFAVKMRQFSQRDLLAERIAAGAAGAAQMRALAVRLAAFHAGAAVAEEGAGQPHYGSLQALARPVMENFAHIEPLLSQPGQTRQLQHIRGWAQQSLIDLEASFLERKSAGFIRQCHGDLHLGNIVVLDGAITLFDCIEFNAQLRWIDTMCDLAYLLMDLEEKGHRRWANQVLNTYLEYSGDYQGLRVLAFYQAYRAVVRAKVSILRLAQADLAPGEALRVLDDYRHYMATAERYTRPARPFLAIMHGVSGSGKSTVAAQIAARTAAVRLRSDVERKRLHGLQPQQSSAALDTDIYSREATAKTFARLEQLAASLLESHYAVIVDATFLGGERRRQFKQLADSCRVPFTILHCRASEQTLHARLEQRDRGQQVSEADIAIMRQQQRRQRPLTPLEQGCVLTIDTDRDLQLQAVVDKLLQ